MNSGLYLTRIWNIPIRLHLSWFIIFGLVTWSLANGYFPQAYPALPAVQYWLLGALTSLLFAASVMLHELGHAWFALRAGVPVRSVTLFIFGGVAQIEKEPPTPGAEFRIAIAGPLVSLALAGLFGGLWLLDRAVPVLAAPSEWLGRINLSLALFNLIPGFPLDGGRVLRAVIWKLGGDFARATRLASTGGQIVAFGFIAFGVWTIFTGNLYNGLWLAFIGWFLQNAAAYSVMHVNLQRSLQGITVAQVMDPNFKPVAPQITLEKLVAERVVTGGESVFVVTDAIHGTIKGMLTLAQVAAVPREQWAAVTAGQVMVMEENLPWVSPQSGLVDALQKMETTHV
jgi:Zn-dependent protease